ncbi:Radial spokehead-like protein [Plasmopara halstedii]|uniref:Radial spokehead-like protein n=1 Tax=Plasmopara halstedii TaxID=4781 RepID=A0A0P1AK23_PLAHL|nr:Radial spokehead-like protein [Plasmopara halstedii]CEG41255.1 Radial spokehead-like protein [Plasmopara halstedii]|eukprot:XP_024577624.1 Radial spokehead-like protein [Plasmopara halstedii]
MTTLEEAKAFLKKESNDGTNLYDHLSDVLLKIIVERPEGLHETFENISTLVKQERYVAPHDLTTDDQSSQVSSRKKEAQTYQENYSNTALDLLKLQTDNTMASTSKVDLLDEANLFEWAGLGFSKSETFRLSLALQSLAQTIETVNLRFWGKILGRKADFYIAEGELVQAYEPQDLEAEEGFAGVNKLTYWAMKDNGTYQWVRLPPVRCEQIVAARQLCRYVQGDLEAPISGHPPFPGLEKNFLRAQIARISAGTALSPAGYFDVTEGEIAPAETFEVKSTEQLLELKNWTHIAKEINARYGRMTPMPPLLNADGEEESREEETFAPPLRDISEDEPLSWRLDRQPATRQPSVGDIAIARSLIWPGAVSIAVGKKFCNIYVGHGVKFRAEPYQLPLPQQLQTGSGVSWSEETSDVDDKPTLSCVLPVEQPDLLEDPSPPTDEED